MNLHRFSLLLFLVLSWAAVSAAETIAVFQLHPTGLDTQTAVVTTQLLRGEMTRLNKATIVESGRMERELGPDAACWDINCAVAAGKKVDADQAVIGTIMGLDYKKVIEVSLVDLSEKKIIYSDKFTAGSSDDIEIVCRKLAQSLIYKRPIESFVNENVISQAEQTEKPVYAASYSLGGAFGFHFPFSGLGGVSKMNELELTSYYDPRNFSIQFIAGLGWGSRDMDSTDYYKITGYPPSQYSSDPHSISATDFHFDVLLLYLLAADSADVAPHVGGGLGIHMIWGGFYPSINSVTSPAFTAIAGVTFFRQYDFHLNVDARYTLLTSTTGIEHQNMQISHGVGLYLSLTHKSKRYFLLF